jgi:hypothetical protein
MVHPVVWHITIPLSTDLMTSFNLSVAGLEGHFTWEPTPHCGAGGPGHLGATKFTQYVNNAYLQKYLQYGLILLIIWSIHGLDCFTTRYGPFVARFCGALHFVRGRYFLWGRVERDKGRNVFRFFFFSFNMCLAFFSFRKSKPQCRVWEREKKEEVKKQEKVLKNNKNK